MSHRRSAMQRYFEFAIWAGRRRLPPNPREVADFFGVHLNSARNIRSAWLNARSRVATAQAQTCVERIEAAQRREAMFERALKTIFPDSAAAEPIHQETTP